MANIRRTRQMAISRKWKWSGQRLWNKWHYYLTL